MAQTIKIEFPIEGKVTIKTEGFKGSACKKATEEIEQMLGSKTSDNPTQEMYEQSNAYAPNRF